MKIYIAGKVTGVAFPLLREKFQDAADTLTAHGWQVINPVELVADPETPWQEAMKICIQALCDCNAIYMLPDWIDSPGAALELNIAYQLKIKIIFHMDKYTVTRLNLLKPGDRFYRIGDPKRIVHEVTTNEGHFKKMSDVWVKRDDNTRPFPMRDINTVIYLRSTSEEKP